jgi:hypothetical protein
MKIIRMILAGLLRLFLLMPVLLLAVIFDGLARMFEAFNDGLMDMSRKLQQITNSPYYGEWERQIRMMEEDRKEAVLKRMKEDNP